MTGPQRWHRYRVPDDAPETSCRSCGAPCVWIETGRRKPDGRPVRMLLDLRSAERDEFGRTAESHFAHCPDAGTWRNRRASQA